MLWFLIILYRFAMLQASRSTESGSVSATMRPPGIKRSTLFRRRDTCSAARRFDPRIAIGNFHGKRSESDVIDNSQVHSKNNENNRTGVYRPFIHKNPSCKNEKETMKPNLCTTSDSSICLENSRVSDDFELWEWNVEETPRRSPAFSKLRSLQRERANVLTELRSSLQKMLQVVREMKNQQSE